METEQKEVEYYKKMLLHQMPELTTYQAYKLAIGLRELSYQRKIANSLKQITQAME
ncbi:hypothetical protein ACYSNX_10025 [Myroides sp. LJL115]